MGAFVCGSGAGRGGGGCRLFRAVVPSRLEGGRLGAGRPGRAVGGRGPLWGHRSEQTRPAPGPRWADTPAGRRQGRRAPWGGKQWLRRVPRGLPGVGGRASGGERRKGGIRPWPCRREGRGGACPAWRYVARGPGPEGAEQMSAHSRGAELGWRNPRPCCLESGGGPGREGTAVGASSPASWGRAAQPGTRGSPGPRERNGPIQGPLETGWPPAIRELHWPRKGAFLQVRRGAFPNRPLRPRAHIALHLRRSVQRRERCVCGGGGVRRAGCFLSPPTPPATCPPCSRR